VGWGEGQRRKRGRKRERRRRRRGEVKERGGESREHTQAFVQKTIITTSKGSDIDCRQVSLCTRIPIKVRFNIYLQSKSVEGSGGGEGREKYERERKGIQCVELQVVCEERAGPRGENPKINTVAFTHVLGEITRVYTV
jgi:hypothetical protein